MENLRGNYVSVCKVPVPCRKEQISAQIQPHLKRGRVLDAEEVSGIETSQDLTRWILWLESHEDANALCDMGRTDIEVEDRSVTVFFEKPLVCQVPKQWEKKVHEESSPVKPPVVPPRRHSSNPLHQQQVVGPYGLQSGFYHNVEPQTQVQIPRTGSEPFYGQGQFHGQRMPGYNQANWPQNVDGHLTGHQSGQPEAAYEVLWPNSMQNQNPHGDGKNYQDPNQFIGGGESQTSAYQRNNEYGQPHYNMAGNARMPMPMPMPPNQQQPIRPMMPYQQGSPGNMQFPIRGQHNMYFQPGNMPYCPDPRTGQQFPAPSPNKMQSQGPDIVTSKERPSPSNMQGWSEPLPNSNYGTAVRRNSLGEGSAVNIQQEVKSEEIHISKCTVEVTGPPKVVCEKELETIEMYFENKKSKGGTVKEIVFKDSAVYVTFESEEVAKRVAEKDDHMINKSPVSVKLLSMKTGVTYEESPDEPLTKILLSNLPSTVHDEFIELFFESKKKLNAGTVLSVDYDEDQHTAIVEFEDPASIGLVLNVSPLEMMGQIVNVEVYNPQPVCLCTVKVTGPADIVCEEQKETLELYFDNAKKSAGGDLKNITFEENAAFVTFAIEEVAFRVAEKKDHTLNKKALEVQLYIPEPAHKSNQGNIVSSAEKCTDDSESEPIVMVKVKGVKDFKSKDIIEFYFENTRKSGGGNLKEVRNDEEDDDVIYMVYESAEVAKKVAEGAHVLEGVKLMTSLYVPPKPPPSYPKRVLIKGLKPTTTEDGLFNFIEAKSGYIPEPSSMIFHAEEEGVVMVTLDKEPEFEKLQTMCTTHKLDGVQVRMYPVPISNCILVTNLQADVTDSTVQFYFENTRKSGGGTVSKVTRNDDDACFVYFENYEDVDSVLKREHYLSKQLLGVKRFLECLGRTEGESEERKLQLPEPVVVKNANVHKIKFLKNSKANKSALEEQLKDFHTRIDWSPESTEVTLHCLLTKEVKDCYKLAKNWKDVALKKFEDFTNTIAVQSIDVLQDTWDNVMEKLRGITIANPEAVAVFVEKKEGLITVAGNKEPTETLAKSITDMIKTVIDEAEKERQKVKESVTTLKAMELKLLQAIQFPSTIEHSFPDLKVKITKNKNEILFEGPVGAVKEAKLKMYEMKNEFTEKAVDRFSPTALELFRSRQVKDFIVNKFKNQQIAGVWEIQGTKLVLLSPSKDTDRCIDILNASIIETSIALTKASGSVVSSQIWNDKVEDWHTAYAGISHVTVDTNVTKMIICSTDDIANDLLNKVKKFLRQNTIHEEVLPCAREKQRLLEKRHKQDVETICKDLKENFVQITFRDEFRGFGVKGTEDGLKIAIPKLEELIKKVKQRDQTVEKPGLEEHMRSPKGQESLHTIESTMPCVISIKYDDTEEHVIEKSFEIIQPHDFPDSKMKIKSTCRVDSKTIFTAVGDMTELPVSVLVNTTDERLNLGGGLGKVIATKGGSVVVEACKDRIQKDGNLSQGDVFMAPAGKLKAKFIVHVVAPVWKNGKENEEKVLEEIVFKTLMRASAKSLTSIALPAISCGGYGFPVKKATAVIVKAVKDFFRKDQETTLTDVYLCDVKDDTVDWFMKALINEFGEHSVHKYDRDNRSKGPPRSANSSDEDSDREEENVRWRGSKKMSPSPPKARQQKEDTIVKFGKMTVSLKKAEIAKEKADVIVNSSAKNLDLKNGAVSASLLKYGGKNLQTEVSSKYPKGIDIGQIAVTGGHDLQCQTVIHTTVPNYDANNDSASLQVLHKLVADCLAETAKQGHGSIAFPAIGTGNLGYPKDKVASEMVAAIAEFSKSNSNSSVREVRFIVYQKDTETIKAFEDELEKCLSGKSGNTGAAGCKMDRENRKVDDTYERLYSKKQEQEEDSDHIYEELPDRPGSGFNNFTVTIKQGDITAEDTDCIVNSSNKDLDLSKGAVSKALLEKCGKPLKKETKKKKDEMAKRSFVWSSAPNLPCQHIIHIVAQDSIKGWTNIMDLCLKGTEERKLKSITFPAFGTGIHSKPSEIAEVMRKSLTDFDQTQPRYVKDVRIVIFQQDMVKEFEDVINTSGKSKGGLMSNIYQGIKGWLGGGGGASASAETKPKRKKPVHPDKVTFTVTSMNNNVIEEAIKRLEKCLEHEIHVKDFDESIIKRMDEGYILEIKAIAKQCNVQLNLTKASGNICISGMAANVMNATDKIHGIIRDATAQEKERETAEIMSSVVQWFFIDITETEQKLTPYEKNLNYKIENAFKSQKETCSFVDNEGKKYIVDFKNMKEYLETNHEDSVNLIRRDKAKEGTFEAPATWGDFKGNLKVVNLAATDQEYQDIEKKFQATAGTPRKVQLIQRIQNKTLWQQYHAKKKQLEDQNPQNTQNEKFLWHGTADDAVDSINAHGFNRSYCGKNAVALGNGVYFAVQTAYSCQDVYSRPNSQGKKHIYYCRVLTGEYIRGAAGMRVPPAKLTGGPNALYDSVVDNPNSPGMYIIFNDTQAYPEYLITFTN